MHEVFSMAGGIKAWEGQVATGGPEAGMAHFAPAVNIEQIIALAWGLEEGSRLFYTGIEERLADTPSAKTLFEKLAVAEVHHKKHLNDSYLAITGKELDLKPHRQELGEAVSGEIMEGGISVAAALTWAETRTVEEIIDFAMALEVNAFDLYIKMSRNAPNQNAEQIFNTLAKEEQNHLQRLAKLMDNSQ